MMNARRIIFVGESRRKFLCQQIHDVVKVWLTNWSFDTNQEVVVNNLRESEMELTGSCFVLKNKNETSFWIGTESVNWESLLWKGSLPQFPKDRTGKRIVDEAVNALQLGLMRGLTKDEGGRLFPVEANPGIDLSRSLGDKVLAFDVQIGNERLVFVVEVGSWLDSYSVVSSSSELSHIYDALASQKIKLPVSMDLGKFDIATIRNVAKGDVLVSEVPLSSLFEVRLDSGRSLDVYLGKMNVRKAVQLQ